MRLSQLTRRMDRGDEICVCLFGAPVTANVLYHGAVRGIGRESALNGMFVNHVCAADSVMVVEVKERERAVKNPTENESAPSRKLAPNI